MQSSKSKVKSHISSSDTSYTISNSSIEKEFSRASSVDSVFDDISSKAHALFSILDEEQKGYLDTQMLLKVCDSGLTEPQINDLIQHLDHDGDGKISSDDFMLGLRTMAKRNSLIRASLRATTVTNSTHYLIGRSSESSHSLRNCLRLDGTNSDNDEKGCSKYQVDSNVISNQSVRIRTKTVQRLHRRLLASMFSQQTTSLITSPLSPPLFDVSSVDDCLKCLGSQEHIYELYHILLLENPSLSRMFETVLVDIVQYIQKSREIQFRLEKQIESERLKHNETIFRLSEEVDNQVKLAEESARIKEREIVMKKFSTEIEAKSMQIKQLKSIIKHLEEYDICQKESYNSNVMHKLDEQNDTSLIKLQTKILQINQKNYNLEEQLNSIKLQLAQSQSEFNGLQQSLSDKNYELEQHMTALIETIKENSTLKRQNGIFQDINRKLYDANDDLYNVFENYPEWLRKEWKVEDINPASSLIDPRFRRTSTEFKPIKSVVKAFSNNEANSSTYNLCKTNLTGGLKPTTSGRNYCVKSKCDHLDCLDSKVHEKQDSGLPGRIDTCETTCDNRLLPHNAKQRTLRVNHRNHTQYTEQFDTHNKLYSISLINSMDSFNDQLKHHNKHQNINNKFNSLKQNNQNFSFIKENIYSTKNLINAKLHIFRIILAGNSAVGKTSLLIRMCDNVFTNCSITTIGVDMKMRSVEVDGRKTMLQIWDTAGQERFRSISTSFYRRADGILLVYDCTSEFSFISTRDWITIIEENAGKQIPIAIVGNKKDLKEQNEWQRNKCVSYATGNKLAREIGALFFETSALTGENVNECIEALARLLCTQEDYNLRCPQLQLSNDTPRQSNEKCCVR
ncbi:hypothetical protein MN116_004630 [Schistosoma mekongi]|uniref:EF-hand domain-containing protein n=1 Tax=Schistosoma mekongi TaxID=38744 RepID=A0AAE1ZDP2_SCHME|nr:hypothetical protein MN116_004630 [Schistosoma mekongi]